MESLIEQEFERLVIRLSELEPGTQEHRKAVDDVEKFANATKSSYLHKKEKWYEKLLNNAPLVTGVFATLGTGMVLYHERAEVITSRAFGWIRFR